jgi:hypothetical protein
MTAPTRTRLAAPATLLVLLGLFLFGLAKVVSAGEHHSYVAGATAPSAVRVTEGRSYEISVHGGVPSLLARGVDIKTPQCTWSIGSAQAQALQVSPENDDTKATNTVASFVAPASAQISIDCAGWGSLFVDDADNAPGDIAGTLLIGGIIALTIGALLALSAARQWYSSAGAPRDDEQVERFVDLGVGVSGDAEVRGADGDDVLS